MYLLYLALTVVCTILADIEAYKDYVSIEQRNAITRGEKKWRAILTAFFLACPPILLVPFYEIVKMSLLSLSLAIYTGNYFSIKLNYYRNLPWTYIGSKRKSNHKAFLDSIFYWLPSGIMGYVKRIISIIAIILLIYLTLK